MNSEVLKIYGDILKTYRRSDNGKQLKQNDLEGYRLVDEEYVVV